MIILLPGNTQSFKNAVLERPDRWGWLVTPRRSLSSTLTTIPGAKWAADNDCWSLGNKFNADKYISFLKTTIEFKESCLFVTAPDVVGNAKDTLERFIGWDKKIRDLGLPVALVAQDGLEDEVIFWNKFDCLFIGGTTKWKLSSAVRDLIVRARRKDKWVHIGRVNSNSRLRYCMKIGAQSVDGTRWAIAPNKNIKQVSVLFDEIELQQQLL